MEKIDNCNNIAIKVQQDEIIDLDDGCQLALESLSNVNYKKAVKEYIQRDKSDRSKYMTMILTNDFDRFQVLLNIGYTFDCIGTLLFSRRSENPVSLVNQYFRDTITRHVQRNMQEIIQRPVLVTSNEVIEVLMNIYNYEIGQGNIEVKEKIISELNAMISGLEPHNFVLKPYGSMVNGITIGQSDVDLSLFKGTETPTPEDHISIKECLADQPGIQDLLLVPSSMPIIKLVHSGIDFDISFGNQHAVDNSELLKAYAQADPRSHPFLVLIKKWATVKGISSASGGGFLSSYSWTNLAIFFLQTINPPVLPCIQFPQGLQHPLNWESANTLKLDQLLLAFFIFYSTFNFNDNLVSISKGVMSRVEDSIFQQLKVGKNWSVFIQDPLLDDVNTGRWLKPCKYNTIKLELNAAVCVLASGSPLSTHLFHSVDKTNLVLSPKHTLN
ncbi:hypothetical protein CYY_000105 [Polysphondylium violaceum]|uniref:Polynucleotide adenylyltransferase n=1 Tax=Polysphondylium violaceum TaxID=133409 RepID=A0A8J4Q3H2_9MYCE|nr:hypothetical protein CYY_000105 [Polysphondylium violaceum]